MDYAYHRVSIADYDKICSSRSLYFLSVYYRLLYRHCKLITAFSEMCGSDLKIEYCSPFSAFGSTQCIWSITDVRPVF